MSLLLIIHLFFFVNRYCHNVAAKLLRELCKDKLGKTALDAGSAEKEADTARLARRDHPSPDRTRSSSRGRGGESPTPRPPSTKAGQEDGVKEREGGGQPAVSIRLDTDPLFGGAVDGIKLDCPGLPSLTVLFGEEEGADLPDKEKETPGYCYSICAPPRIFVLQGVTKEASQCSRPGKIFCTTFVSLVE